MGAIDIFNADGVAVSVDPLVQDVPEPPTLALIVPLLLLVLFLRSKRAVAACSVFCAMSVGAMASAHAKEDLSAYVSISKSGAVLNRTSGTYDYIVTVTNTSSNPILAPLTLGIKDIGGPEVAVHNVVGLDENDFPQVVIALDFGVLKPGASVKVPVRFLNPRAVPIRYTVTAIGTILTAQQSATL